MFFPTVFLIFYAKEEEKQQAQEFIELVNKSKRWEKPVATTLEPLTRFTVAEPEHQDYLQKHPGGYTCHFIRPNWKLPARKLRVSVLPAKRAGSW